MLNKWLESLYINCADPKRIQLSLTLEQALNSIDLDRWGDVVITYVQPKQYNINQLTEICYKQSTAPYIFLSGDDTICRTKNWDRIFYDEIMRYKDRIILLYPNDKIFGNLLACYPVTSRVIMDAVEWPVPYKRYAVDDHIFDIVPRSRRIYFEEVVMEHLHTTDKPPGHAFIRDGKQLYYPINPELMAPDMELYQSLQAKRDVIRLGLEKRMKGYEGAGIKVMVCVPTGEFGRRADFYDYFNMLEKPDGTMIASAHGQSPARNRNVMIKTAIEAGATHCLFLDDDMGFKPDLLMRLLRHNKDIVSGLYLSRNYPHLPIAFDEAYGDGKCRYMFLTPDKKGLLEVKNLGLGACLIKTDVFKAMEKPWIRLGEEEKDHWGDDISFFNRARRAGYRMYVDCDTRCGHMAIAILWPNQDEKGNWFTAYDTNGTGMFQVPQQIPTQEQIDEQLKQEGYAMK